MHFPLHSFFKDLQLLYYNQDIGSIGDVTVVAVRCFNYLSKTMRLESRLQILSRSSITMIGASPSEFKMLCMSFRLNCFSLHA